MDIIRPERKRFATWMWVKRDLHDSGHNPPFFKEGEVWWCHTGENVGIEINGKGDEFVRPILIYKKYNKQSFFGLPLTTKSKLGTWYTPVDFRGKTQFVILVQGSVFDFKRLKHKAGELKESDMMKVKEGYLSLHDIKINLPPSLVGVVGSPKYTSMITK